VLAFVNPAASGSTVDILTTTDALGRTSIIQRRQAPGASNFDSVQYIYGWTANIGPFQKVSMPYVGTQGQAAGTVFTTTQSDALGRSSSVVDAGGGSTTYQYTAQDVLFTTGPPPAGEQTKRRQMEYDGLGRLKSVCELTSGAGSGSCAQANPTTGFWTKYTYDALANLTTVTQNSQGSPSQNRSYFYDGLSRLISETNPEWNSVAATYTYDTDGTCGTSNGDLVKKVDPAGNVTCTTYDGLHRPTSITYPSGPNSAATPTKSFVYDAATVNSKVMQLAKGRLAEAYTGAKTTDLGFSYDADGRIIDFYESTPHSSGYYDVTASYWANGALSTLKGVSLPTLTYGPNGEGLPNTVSASSGVSPVSSTSYNPAGHVTDVTFGSSDPVHFGFDNMGRMTQYKLTINGTATHGDPTWNQNGTLGSLAITDPFNAADAQTCTYGYDDLARLASAHCGASTWQQDFTYDAFGNITKSGSISFQPGYNQSTNHYLTAADCVTTGATPCYDGNGNLLKDGTDHVYSWDADGHPVTLDSDSLVYDALGREVEVFKGGAYTEFVFGPTGKLALMNGQTQSKAFVALPGGTQVKYAGSAISTYRLPDWLGSFRVGSNPNRTYSWGVAFAPFGEQYAPSGGPALSFTGEEGTADTVNDEYDFQYRKLHSAQGRWISPDPAGLTAANAVNPQSWNRYVYALNNPLMYTDPSGLFCYYGDTESWDDWQNPSNLDYNSSDGECAATGGAWYDDVTTDISTPPNMDDYSNFGLLWLSGQGPNEIDYGANDGWTLALANSATFDLLRQTYIQQGCSNTGGPIPGGSHIGPYVEGYVEGPLGNPALMQVGGFSASGSTTGSTTTFTITNNASNSSFLGLTTVAPVFNAGLETIGEYAPSLAQLSAFDLNPHGLDNPSGPSGPRHNINQVFTWTESNLCSPKP
jgi:RHS repeat-associated protein